MFWFKSHWFHLQSFDNGSGYDLVPNRQQYITWNNDDPVYQLVKWDLNG